MTKKTGQSKFFLLAILFFGLPVTSFCVSQDSLNLIRTNAVRNIRLENPDSAVQILKSLYTYAIEAEDTLLAINTLTNLATVYGNMPYYGESYNSLWKALLLVDEAKLDYFKVYVLQRIGRYYAFYKRREKALEFLNQSLALNKALVTKGEMEKPSLTHRYIAFCYSFQEFGELELAQTYLDSCFLMYEEHSKSSLKLPYLKMQQAVIDVGMGKSAQAIQDLEALIPWFEETLPTYLVLIYTYLGDAYQAQGDKSKSEWCYQKSLSISAELHSHRDFAILTREKLAKLHFDQRQYPSAYLELEKSIQQDRLYFDSRSEYNRSLLEIQDDYLNAMETKEKLLKEKRIAQLEHENKETFLRNVIFAVLLVFSIIFAVLLYFYLKKKYQIEKEMINLEMKANKELLEMKNKELATNALKLVEKDKFLEELKKRVNEKKENITYQEINHLIKTETIGKSNSWKAFESQFVEVNNGFFRELINRFPNLTQGERRLCALIKLKLTSKEIASLMGISAESVHKSRYRLRKKLDLGKGQNLTDFIGKIV